MKHQFIAALAMATAMSAAAAETLTSPDGNVTVTFDLTPQGQPCYSVAYRGKTVVRPSLMGFELKDAPALTTGFTQTGVSRSSFDETWAPVWGENDSIVNRYNGMTVALSQPTDSMPRLMDIEFRAFDDGIGFRYIFPQQAPTFKMTITGEATQMAMTGDHKAWWIPGDYDTQEYHYYITRLSQIPEVHKTLKPRRDGTQIPDAVQTALMLKTDDGLYLNLHEAALIDFPAMHLQYDAATQTFTAALTPGGDGTMATITAPFTTPWRTVTVSDKATDILASALTLNLNEPCAIADTSWIHPTKYMGVWWEMITGKSSWSYTDAEDFDLATFDYSKAKPNGTHGANTENVKRYIDFAADNGFDQLLIEGWNIGWEDWFNKQKDYVFDFLTPYPDFDIAVLNEYAQKKGIKLMMHHETSGAVGNYERHMERAYDLMNKYGYDAVKSGYVGDILPLGEHHYSQGQVNHYLNAVRRAADHHIMVNAHEAVRPTGLCRTWPNLVGNESALGTEYLDMAPQHVTILPFTRLKGGPMDFTPGIFEMDITKFVPNNPSKKMATVANQLALYVTMYSPLQMAADLPEHYAEKADAFQFIRDVPCDWSKSIYLDAEPGEYIIAARKDKKSNDWYVGGVTNEDARDYTLDYSRFLTPGVKYEATLYADSKDADWQTNPHAYKITKQTVTSNTRQKLHLAPGGGFAISIKEMTK